MYNFTPLSLPGHDTALFWPQADAAYSQTPDDLFLGMTVSGTDLVIPIAALADHGLTAALAAASTGDARVVAYAFLGRIEEWYTELTEATRPLAITATTRLGIGYTTSDFPDKEKTELKFFIYRNRPEGTVADEP